MESNDNGSLVITNMQGGYTNGSFSYNHSYGSSTFNISLDSGKVYVGDGFLENVNGELVWNRADGTKSQLTGTKSAQANEFYQKIQ